MKKREFSLYDIEQFLREAGAERVNEKALISLEKELEDTVRELVEDAGLYASYAGRKRLIKSSDIELARYNRIGNGVSREGLKAHVLRKRPRRGLNQNRIKMQRLSELAQAHMLKQ